MNVLEVIQSTTGYFAKRGIESPRLNAEHLIAHALGRKRIELYMEFDRLIEERELVPLRGLVRKRGDGEPLQHLLGTAEFHGRIFLCDARALVPRPETEQLAEMVIADCKSRPVEKILDVGTGSGVIALTLAAELKDATVEAVDLSEEALTLAQENAGKIGMNGRVNFFKSDLFEKVTSAYDLIVANLPYIASDALPALSREVRRDPQTALDGGTVGHELILRFAENAPRHLRPGGRIALEIGDGQDVHLITEFQRLGFQQIICKADYQGINRFLFAHYG